MPAYAGSSHELNYAGRDIDTGGIDVEHMDEDDGVQHEDNDD